MRKMSKNYLKKWHKGYQNKLLHQKKEPLSLFYHQLDEIKRKVVVVINESINQFQSTKITKKLQFLTLSFSFLLFSFPFFFFLSSKFCNMLGEMLRKVIKKISTQVIIVAIKKRAIKNLTCV